MRQSFTRCHTRIFVGGTEARNGYSAGYEFFKFRVANVETNCDLIIAEFDHVFD